MATVFGFSADASTTNRNSTTTGSERSTFNNSTLPVVPDWIEQANRSLAGRLTNLRDIDPYSRVSGSNAWIDEAAGRAANLGRFDPWEQEAGAIAHATADAPVPRVAATNLLDNLKSYESPYIQNVVDAALADYDYGAGRTRAQQSLDFARQGAFGGSGSALARSFTEGELARGRANTSATLRDQGFNRAAQLADQDAGRRQSAAEANARFAADAQQRNLAAAQQMAQLSSQHAANSRADIGVINDMGQTLRGIDTAWRQAPFSAASQDIELQSGLPQQLFVGSAGQGSSEGSSSSTTNGRETTLKAGFSFKP